MDGGSTSESRQLPEVPEARLAETVRRVNAKAFELLKRRDEIDRRIHWLRQVMRGLRDLYFSRGYSDVHAAPVPQAWLRQSAVCPQGDDALGRACRIALMESEAPASISEIRQRIARRGSYIFADVREAHITVRCALDAMASAGEIACISSETECRWQRAVVAKEIEWSFSQPTLLHRHQHGLSNQSESQPREPAETRG